jgi:hypothetical protein
MKTILSVVMSVFLALGAFSQNVSTTTNENNQTNQVIVSNDSTSYQFNTKTVTLINCYRVKKEFYQIKVGANSRFTKTGVKPQTVNPTGTIEVKAIKVDTIHSATAAAVLRARFTLSIAVVDGSEIEAKYDRELPYAVKYIAIVSNSTDGEQFKNEGIITGIDGVDLSKLTKNSKKTGKVSNRDYILVLPTSGIAGNDVTWSLPIVNQSGYDVNFPSFTITSLPAGETRMLSSVDLKKNDFQKGISGFYRKTGSNDPPRQKIFHLILKKNGDPIAITDSMFYEYTKEKSCRVHLRNRSNLDLVVVYEIDGEEIIQVVASKGITSINLKGARNSVKVIHENRAGTQRENVLTLTASKNKIFNLGYRSKEDRIWLMPK